MAPPRFVDSIRPSLCALSCQLSQRFNALSHFPTQPRLLSTPRQLPTHWLRHSRLAVLAPGCCSLGPPCHLPLFFVTTGLGREPSFCLFLSCLSSLYSLYYFLLISHCLPLPPLLSHNGSHHPEPASKFSQLYIQLRRNKSQFKSNAGQIDHDRRSTRRLWAAD